MKKQNFTQPEWTQTIVLLAGPSGSGKSTVAKEMEKKYGMKQVDSYTTRPPRYEGETGHIFVSEEEFDSLKDLCAFTVFNGYRYGVTSDVVDACDIYVIDTYGIEYLKKHYKGNTKIISVALNCSPETAGTRMRTRGDGEDAVNSRLENDKKAFANLKDVCDIYIDVDSLTVEDTVRTVVESVNKFCQNKTVAETGRESE